ncbi:MAG: FAD-dependent oxidoreductase [Acidimicrobiia bacterium]|nr:MAG: FAD-dependent oxidoreductase [Acidimicrobiia bacterium]
MTDVDVVVIGAGIAGASVAYELARDHDVVVLEQEPVAGYHTTGRSAAVFTETYHRGPVQALAVASRPFFEHPPDVLAGTELLTPLPVMIIARAEQREAFDRYVEEAPDSVEVIEGAALAEYCPILGDDIVVGALEPGAMEIDVAALHQGYLTGIRLRGGEIRLESRTTAIEPAGDRWRVGAGGKTLTAPVVVNASGAWGDEVAELAGVAPLGITPFRRSAFTFAGPEGPDFTLGPMIIDVEEEFYLKPERSQFMGSLAEETPMTPQDVGVEEVDVALAIQRIEAATTLSIRHVRTSWAGLRTFTTDRVPAIGFDPDHPGFFWLVGQGGFGIMTAPAAARTAAALVAGHRLPDDVIAAGLEAGAIDPARFR